MSAKHGDDGSDVIEVRALVPGDAEGVSGLVERCYGDAYPKRVMYETSALAKRIRSSEHNGVVATAGGSVVGHMSYSWPASDATVVEAGTTAVDPEWRGKGLMNKLALALAESLVSDGAVGFVHFPTTAHVVMQKASLGAGGRETGIMLAYLPPGVSGVASVDDDPRLAVTVVYQPVAESPAQLVCLPRRYEDLVLGMAEGLGLDREATQPLRRPDAEGLVEINQDPSRDLVSFVVDRVGTDLAAQVNSAIEASSARLAHADLPMNDPGIDYAVERLRPLGFGFAAWMPGWAGCDVLRLQRVEDPSESELSPELFSPEAEDLMALIRSEILPAP